MKKIIFKLPAAILVMCLVTTSCSQAVTEAPASLPEESVTETTVEPFEPILITEDYDGPILGIENWHIEKTAYWDDFINDDTGEIFADCIGTHEYYLADPDNDGQPELVCNEKWGLKWNYHACIYKLEGGVISHADISLGSDVLGPGIYPEFAEIYGLDINSQNFLDYQDIYDLERNIIIVTDLKTGTEYEVLWDYLVWYTDEEINAMIEAEENASHDPANYSSDIIDITYSAAEPVITDISDTEKEITFFRDGMEIEGKLYLPEGEGPFPVIVLCCGLMQQYSDYEADAKGFADNGYAAVVFSFIGYSDPNGEQPTDNGEVFLSETTDLYAVMDSLDLLPGVDTSNVYLWGHSFGGLVAAYAGCDRESELKGMILVEPTIVAGEKLDVIYEDGTFKTIRMYPLLFDCDLNTVIYMGTHDGFGDDPTSFDHVIVLLRYGELVIIDGADHFFEGEHGEKMVADACEKISSWNE